MEDNDTHTITITLATVKIAGTQYHVGSDLLNTFKVGDAIDLRLEPANPYDNKAVEVLWRDRSRNSTFLKVGYIPKPLNQTIFALGEAGYNLQAEVTNDSDRSITITLHP